MICLDVGNSVPISGRPDKEINGPDVARGPWFIPTPELDGELLFFLSVTVNTSTTEGQLRRFQSLRFSFSLQSRDTAG